MDYRLDLGYSAAGVPLRWENASNGHIALLGQSGRGKSFTMRNLLAQLPEQGVHAYVFDYSGDFRGETARSLFARCAAAVDVRDVRQQARINPFRSFPQFKRLRADFLFYLCPFTWRKSMDFRGKLVLSEII